MIQQEESIYSLIPKEEPPKEKQKMHKSKYPAELPPTYSTFCLKTTSMPGVANVSGAYDLPCGAHKTTAMNATFGLPKGAAKPDANRFTKRNTGTMKLPESKFHKANISLEKEFKYKDIKKPAIPAKDEKPIMGLVSEKNYIVANAVENILAGINSSLIIS
jgi:hypothetical protein